MRLLCVFIFGTVVFPFFGAATDGSVLAGLLGSVYSLSLIGFFLFNFITCISYSGANSVSFSVFFFSFKEVAFCSSHSRSFLKKRLSSFHSSSLIVHTALHNAAQMINIFWRSDFYQRALNSVFEISFAVHRLLFVPSLFDPVYIIGVDHRLFRGSKLRGFTEVWLGGSSAFYADRRLQPHRTSRQRLARACDRTQVGLSVWLLLLNFKNSVPQKR